MTTSIKAEIAKKLSAQMSKLNQFALPQMLKVVINYRVPEARENAESLTAAQEELMAISGRKPGVTRAKQAISNFKTRIGDPLALRVTLRGPQMYDFIEKLFNLVLPRLRDFKGMPVSQFDANGNYNFTIMDQTYFPEINLNKANKIRPIQITLVTTATSPKDAKMLLSALGFPFEK